MKFAWDIGDEIINEYPFVRVTYTDWREDGLCDEVSWRPGCEYEQCGPEGETAAVYDGLGKQILSIVDLHKPGSFPWRVFYTCKWVSPEGKVFGKNRLRITTIETFNRRARGFMSHEPFFEMHLRGERV